MKLEKNSSGRSQGKMLKGFGPSGHSPKARDKQIQNAALDGQNESNDISGINDSLASVQKLKRGKKPLKAGGVPVTAGTMTDKTNEVSQVTDESNNTNNETHVSVKGKAAKKRKAQKQLADKTNSEDDSFSFVASEKRSCSSFDKAFRRYVSLKKRKSELSDDSGKDGDKGESVKGKHKKLGLQKKKMENAADSEADADVSAAEQLQYWKQLRQDLERVRLLLELIRKREKMKSSLVGFCFSVLFDCAVLVLHF